MSIVRAKVVNNNSNLNLFTFLLTEYSEVNTLSTYVKRYADHSGKINEKFKSDYLLGRAELGGYGFG